MALEDMELYGNLNIFIIYINLSIYFMICKNYLSIIIITYPLLHII